MQNSTDDGGSGKPTLFRRAARLLRPSHEHSVFSATLLLMTAVMLSRVIGYVREAYIAWAFGAGPLTDAYNAAFTIPDFLNYLVAGGAASITFISIYTRFLAEKREEDAQQTFSVIVTVMSTVLLIGIVVMEIFARPVESVTFPGFNATQLALCVHMTRILLPAQLFFYVGAVLSAVLQSRRMFLIPAVTGLVYNVGIIAGGVIGARQFGISSLAVGAVAGCIAGPFLLNAVGAARTGMRYRPSFDLRNPAFREWVMLSIPLMLGVSLATADDWILRFFASHGIGDITRLNYAKRLFAVPMAVLGQATGQASLPFFARLWSERKTSEFARQVNGSVFRVSAVSFLGSAWMMAAALPIVDLVYRRGHFLFADSRETAVLFFWFAISLVFWSAQALYARAFYAVGNTLTPMLAATIVTAVSLPIYWALFHALNVTGLALASDIGIGANTIVLAVLLHRRGFVRITGLPWREIWKALATAIVAGALALFSARVITINGSRIADAEALGIATLTWAAAVAAGLWLTCSELPRNLSRRTRAVTPINGIAPPSNSRMQP
ncbi:MAG: murein biosynthesis integral membrane protein MurJ [Terriglobales bacterium]